jgi:hypothetical protein
MFACAYHRPPRGALLMLACSCDSHFEPSEELADLQSFHVINSMQPAKFDDTNLATTPIPLSARNKQDADIVESAFWHSLCFCGWMLQRASLLQPVWVLPICTALQMPSGLLLWPVLANLLSTSSVSHLRSTRISSLRFTDGPQQFDCTIFPRMLFVPGPRALHDLPRRHRAFRCSGGLAG